MSHFDICFKQKKIFVTFFDFFLGIFFNPPCSTQTIKVIGLIFYPILFLSRPIRAKVIKNSMFINMNIFINMPHSFSPSLTQFYPLPLLSPSNPFWWIILRLDYFQIESKTTTMILKM